MKEIAAILQQALTPAEYETLTRLTHDWSLQPFEYHPDTGTVELNDHWLRRLHRSLEYQDLFLKACDILSRSRDQLNLKILAAGEDTGGKIVLRFNFASDASQRAVQADLRVGNAFVELLTQNTDHRVMHHHLGEKGMEVVIEVVFTNDWDLFRKKEEIKSLLEIAQRQRDERPFFGRRL